jgi:hypothetical protein
MRQPHETATQPVQLVPAAEAITCSEHVVLQHFLRCMVLVLHFLHTHWWEILLHRSTTAAFTSSLIGMCHHSSIHKQPHWYVSPQQHSQAASLACVTTAAFTSSLIGMCHPATATFTSSLIGMCHPATAPFTSSLIGMCHHSSTQRLTLSPESCCRGELLAWPRVGGGGAGGSGGDRFKSPTGMCWAWPAVSALRASSCLIFSLQVCIRMRAYSNMWVSKALRAT